MRRPAAPTLGAFPPFLQVTACRQRLQWHLCFSKPCVLQALSRVPLQGPGSEGSEGALCTADTLSHNSFVSNLTLCRGLYPKDNEGALGADWRQIVSGPITTAIIVSSSFGPLRCVRTWVRCEQLPCALCDKDWQGDKD